MGRQVSLMLIDGSRLFREGIKRIFQDGAFKVCQEAGSPGIALSMLRKLPADLVLTEFYEEDLRFADQIAGLRQAAPSARIVILTDGVDAARLKGALEAAADGYLLKDMSADALKQSLHLVMLGEKVFPTDLARHLVNGSLSTSESNGAHRSSATGRALSERELQILGCLLDGYSNKRIANQLQISEGTVKVHLKGILKKINVQNRTQAAIWALSNRVGSRHNSPITAD